jgi:hypothetical protein
MGGSYEVCVPILAVLTHTSLNINRDGWWIFTTCRLIYIIKHTYDISLSKLIKQSPRFGVLITSMMLSIAFIFIDIVVTVHPLSGTEDGVNPFWKVWNSFYGRIHGGDSPIDSSLLFSNVHQMSFSSIISRKFWILFSS